MRVFFVLACLLFASALSGQAIAQSMLPDDIPEEYIQEAQDFQDYCGTQFTYLRYHDCECLAANYLQTRIDMGPFAEQGEIELAINDSCFDIPKIAGESYAGCAADSALLPAGDDVEGFCECMANSYAKGFERANRRVTSKLIVNLRTSAIVNCAR